MADYKIYLKNRKKMMQSMKKKGLSLRDIADEFGISHSRVAAILRG